uniref:Uncharacterized protein n=1 Tax=Mesocestoides corti TaxID=53468 RepID=A0A5K3FIZ2_MESCO
MKSSHIGLRCLSHEKATQLAGSSTALNCFSVEKTIQTQVLRCLNLITHSVDAPSLRF